jgi:hypothetical protein
MGRPVRTLPAASRNSTERASRPPGARVNELGVTDTRSTSATVETTPAWQACKAITLHNQSDFVQR